jgi:thiol-disulfide isomerase/thioredoxin
MNICKHVCGRLPLYVVFFAIIAFASVLLFATCQQPQAGYVNGMTLPDITITDANGKSVSISDYRGNIVLLDFWASWCKPCRKANPKLVRLYEKYKHASFRNAERLVIISISIDNNREAWMKAIKEDGTEQFIHLSELNGWKSKAVDLYHIDAIPASFLLDENGIIIGKNLSEKDLDLILSKRVF